jgi:hypothetical protein
MIKRKILSHKKNALGAALRFSRRGQRFLLILEKIFIRIAEGLRRGTGKGVLSLGGRMRDSPGAGGLIPGKIFFPLKLPD